MGQEGRNLSPVPVQTGKDLLLTGPGQEGHPGSSPAQALQPLGLQKPIQLIHHLAQGAPAVHQALVGIQQAVAQRGALFLVGQLLHIPQVDVLPIDAHPVPPHGLELDPVPVLERGGWERAAVEAGGGGGIQIAAHKGPGIMPSTNEICLGEVPT